MMIALPSKVQRNIDGVIDSRWLTDNTSTLFALVASYREFTKLYFYSNKRVFTITAYNYDGYWMQSEIYFPWFTIIIEVIPSPVVANPSQHMHILPSRSAFTKFPKDLCYYVKLFLPTFKVVKEAKSCNYLCGFCENDVRIQDIDYFTSNLLICNLCEELSCHKGGSECESSKCDACDEFFCHSCSQEMRDLECSCESKVCSECYDDSNIYEMKCDQCDTNYCGDCTERCDRCEDEVCGDCDLCLCETCEETLCHECFTCCDQCGDCFCENCIEDCDQCQEPVCMNCIEDCDECLEPMCRNCIDDHECGNYSSEDSEVDGEDVVETS